MKFNAVIPFALLFLSNMAYSNYTFAASEGQRPTTLELQVIQTRIYETSKEELFETVRELCVNNGGLFARGIPQGKVDMTMFCGTIKLPALKEFFNGRGWANLNIDVNSIESKRIRVRVRLEDPYGPPVYKRLYYEAVFKEISETLGLLAIPVEIKNAD
jgi:hypothetical protein